MAALILVYFDECKDSKPLVVMPTKAGLCLALDITRDTYNEYKKKPDFSDTLKKAELLMENLWTQRLGGTSPTGAIFYLKNAFKEHYKDRYNTDVTTKGKQIATFDEKQLETIARRVLNGGAAGPKPSRRL